jgi:hypothetical protein
VEAPSGIFEKSFYRENLKGSCPYLPVETVRIWKGGIYEKSF